LLKIINYFLLLNYVFAQSYSLDDCVNIALENKKTILSATLGVKFAKKGLTGSYNNLLPYISFNANNSRTNFPERTSISGIDVRLNDFSLDTTYNKVDHYNNVSTGLILNQTLYNGGRNLNQVRQSQLNLEKAYLNERLIKTQVIQKVIQSYYSLLQAQKLFDVADKNLEMSTQQVELVEKQFKLGVVKKTDLLKAQVAQGQAKVDLLNKKTSLANFRRVLFNDMGLQDFGQEILASEKKWTFKIILSSTELLKSLKESNPSLLISAKQTELTNSNYKLIKGLRRPSINSSINYSANSTELKLISNAIRDDWSLGINFSLSIPIYTGNNLSMQKQQAKISINQAEYGYITLLNDLRVQGELIRESLENYSEIIPINESVVLSAEEDLKLVRERYSLGSATILEVLDAQISLFRSNSTLINSIHNARVQEANLKAIIGSLDLEYKIKEN
jgi:outer membrane protein